MNPQEQTDPQKKPVSLKSGGLFMGMNVKKKIANPTIEETLKNESKPILNPHFELSVTNNSQVEDSRDDLPPHFEDIIAQPQSEKKKVPFFKNLKTSKLQHLENEENTSNLEIKAVKKDDLLPIINSPQIITKQSPDQKTTRYKTQQIADNFDDEIQDNSLNKEDFSKNTFKFDSRLQTPPKPEPDTKNELPTKIVPCEFNSETDKNQVKQPSSHQDSFLDQDINLLDQIEFSIPSYETPSLDDDFMNLNYQKTEIVDSVTPTDTKPKKSAIGFIKKLKEARNIIPNKLEESNRRDDSSILEKINQNLNEISGNSKEDLNNSVIETLQVSFSQKIKTDFKIEALNEKINAKFGNFVEKVLQILVSENEEFKAESAKESKEKQVSVQIDQLEKTLAESLAVEDYDQAETVQLKIDELKNSLEQKNTKNKTETKPKKIEDIFENEKDKISEELKKIGGHKIFIKEKMMFFEENETSNYEKLKKSLGEAKKNLSVQIDLKAKEVDLIEEQLSEKQSELKNQIQTSETTLNLQTTKKELISNEIEALKKQLIQKENELFTIDKEINSTQENINDVKRKFEPVLSQLTRQKSKEQEILTEVKNSKLKTDSNDLKNEENYSKAKEELTILEKILSDIEHLKVERSSDLSAIVNKFKNHFQTNDLFEQQSKTFKKLKIETEAKTATFDKIKDEIKFVELEIVFQNNEIAKIQEKKPVVETNKKESVKNKNFAQAKHFSNEFKVLENQEIEKQELLKSLLSELDLKQKQIPLFEKQFESIFKILNQGKLEFIESGIQCAKDRLEFGELLVKIGGGQNENISLIIEEFKSATVQAEIEREKLIKDISVNSDLKEIEPVEEVPSNNIQGEIITEIKDEQIGLSESSEVNFEN